MMGPDILNIKALAGSDTSITSYQHHAYSPYSTSYGYNDEIRICIQSQDLYTLPCESYIYLEATIVRAAAAAATDINPSYVGNFPAFLFSEIRYELSGTEIDKTRNPGITSVLKGIPSIRSDEAVFLKSSGFLADATSDPTTISCCLPLKCLLGFFEDHKRIIINARQELILVRSRNDINCFTGVNDIMHINIERMTWMMPHVKVSDTTKIQLLKSVDQKHNLPIAFRSWDLQEYPVLPTTTKNIWQIKTTTKFETPRYVIVGFQTNRLNRIQGNPSKFDPCDVRDIKLFLNGEMYPYENMNLDFASRHYASLYFAFCKFQETYYHGSGARTTAPVMSYAEFRLNPIFVIDTSRQDEAIKNSTVDVRIVIETRAAMPASTTAYALILSDRFWTYNPFTNIVTQNI